MEQVALIVLGAALGFVGSIVGTVWVGRLGLRQERRLRIYDDLIPELRKQARAFEGGSIETTQQTIEDIQRAAVVLSMTERELATKMRRIALDYREAFKREVHQDGMGGWLQPPDDGEAAALRDEFLVAQETLGGLLALKLQGRRRLFRMAQRR